MKPTQYPHRLYQAPKSPQPARTLTIEEKAAKFDVLMGLRKSKKKAKQTISKLYRDIERMEAEEAHVLDDDTVSFIRPEDERCSNCGYLSCVCELVS